ncbi:NADP-dependent phosphogluconate dehydrogenase [Polyangium jinanense]|uniref:6-phosphogluconate dehydrogenase, decarboxylating n=1 Tax=Polyangium jinanense TaxID=2829994 RepID=A0A9X3X3J7_9BACT|nr:NADP-dependent phosphogluconate dehydrogenase [Polyangium jinanense]MDC3953924.1 NADP-dependent phosphogluconate dehydrogenase [Polyangium jinanense]MDC3957863.1 NADP-dependent phosphogluconate dehydrogenase [Polyangium jinanense]MDC3978949.1 NADP-dependent phosphogluconate dehydrogenase [Polyangium jinanense]MDC3982120.1 NADP-dependent phosphogluconate dehydrogenase [Polyangium jinanense]
MEAAQAKIGLVGLGVMGENLALNIERHGFPIAVYNREPQKVDHLLATRAKGLRFFGAHSPAELARVLERPRKIILLVKAGQPVDWTVDQIRPYLEPGDIIIDGGNSWYEDTERRQRELGASGIRFLGSGVSGGEEGALWGPSLMPGGERAAYEEIRPIWEAIAAKVDDGPCVTYIGPGGSGHFVKMVHNGIEYGDMQLIAEAYDILHRGLGFSADRLAEVFARWNEGVLSSFLIEITAKIFRAKDSETSAPLVDLILDKAGQKGTGLWTSKVALDLGVAIPTIDAAIMARLLSGKKNERIEAAKVLEGPRPGAFQGDENEIVTAVHDALYAAKICSYTQGMALLRAASDTFHWDLPLGEIARIWKGGCIIRAQFLDGIREAYAKRPDLPSLLLDDRFREAMAKSQPGFRKAIAFAQSLGIPCLAFSSSLAYYDSYRSARLPQNLTQAQRDYFGAHTYERVDKPELGAVHTDWPSLVG